MIGTLSIIYLCEIVLSSKIIPILLNFSTLPNSRFRAGYSYILSWFKPHFLLLRE